MQKYIPTIRLVCETARMSHTYQFPETAFIAVTAYQNSKASPSKKREKIILTLLDHTVKD